MKVSGQPVSIPKPLQAGPKAPQPKANDRAAQPHGHRPGRAHHKPHAARAEGLTDRVTTHTKPAGNQPDPAPQRTAEKLGSFRSSLSAPKRPGGGAQTTPAPQRTAEKLGSFTSGLKAPQRPGTTEPPTAPAPQRTAEKLGSFASGQKAPERPETSAPPRTPAGERTAELLGRFRANVSRPAPSGETDVAKKPVTTEIRRGAPKDGDLRSNNAQHQRGHRGSRSIRAFEQNVHNALKEVRQGLRESGLSGEELRTVRKQLNGLEKEFRSSLKGTRQSLRAGELGPREAASAVSQAFEGLVGGIEGLTTSQEEGAPTSGAKVSLQFVGKAGSSFQFEAQVGGAETTATETTEGSGTEEVPTQVTDRRPAGTETGAGGEVTPRPRPLVAALREGFSSLLSSLESLSSAYEPEVAAENEETEKNPPLTTVAVSTEESEASSSQNFQVQVAVSSYAEVNVSISIATGGEELNVSA